MASPRSPKSGTINAYRFFNEYKGHPIEDIATTHASILSQRGEKPIVFLAGDSSLDNKYWIPSAGPGGSPLPVPVPDIYHGFLKPPVPKPDVAFWLNHHVGVSASCLNCAVEESTLGERQKLLPHDEFIRDNIRQQDMLIVSVGGNDIACKPTLGTAVRMLRLTWLNTRSAIEAGTAGPLAYFKDIFGAQVEEYISKMTAKRKPRAVIVCMIYFPFESGISSQSSWADLPLKAMGYHRRPGHLQAVIRKIYEAATCEINIKGTNVVPCPLFEVMDGKEKGDYVQRVEPSVEGGRKMAERFADTLRGYLEM
ncbi:hypothetical protein K402DRAFT_425808 [Aulographum hederae CBS 113979]|uniref:SGNH hydrolase n=1 Tax=Aulographum hederae CBS 113979 TaxID=1176131 RepID=A0A6G1GJG1_9PEZI|nr:hypothetical protein K402DRAFT_425808 [Aulographum hederae CBS 113979]